MSRKILVLIAVLFLLFTCSLAMTPPLFSDSAALEEISSDPRTAELDQALFASQAVAGNKMDMPRPAAERVEALSLLLQKYPDFTKAARLLADTRVALGQQQEAESFILEYLASHPDSFPEVAAFFHARLQYEREIEILDRGAGTQQGSEAVTTLRKILLLQEKHLLNIVDQDSIYKRMIATEPEDHMHLLAYADYLEEDGRGDEAIALITGGFASYPDAELRLKERLSRLYQKAGRIDEALALYQGSFDIDRGLDHFSTYKNILRTSGRLESHSRSLKRLARTETLTDEQFIQLFLLYKSDREYDKAESLLHKHAASMKTADEALLLRFARGLKGIERHEASLKYAYAAYLTGTSDKSKAEALHLMITAQANQMHGGAPFAVTGLVRVNPGLVDSMPGFSGGLLSLLYNNTDLSLASKDLERATRQRQKALLLQKWFETFKSDYGRDQHITDVYASVVKALGGIGLHQQAVKIAEEEFYNQYAGDPNFKVVAEAVLPSFRALKQKQKIASTYDRLIHWAYANKQWDDYYRYISDITRHYTSENQLKEVVSLYWDQIQRRPEDEQLYSRFLSFLDSYRIFDEQEKVYKQAIKQFDERNYYDKLARWYIRQKKDAELRAYIEEVADVFRDSELYDFLRDFTNYGRNATDADSVFYRRMFEYANQRFPRNSQFVGQLLRYYSRFKLWDDYRALAFRYFYSSGTIRKQLLAHLSEEQMLNGLLSRIVESEPQLSNSAHESVNLNSHAAVLFVSSARQWQSYYEASLPFARLLAVQHPDQPAFIQSLAGLSRSLESNAEALAAYDAMILVEPSVSDHYVKAGELAMETDGAEKAGDYWLQIPKIARGDSSLYKETATLFWDYYQYDEALEVLTNGRELLKNDHLFGIEMGILLEEKKMMDAAIDEYIAFATANTNSFSNQNRALERLRQLAEKRNLADNIIKAFDASLENNDYSKDAVLTYDEYLGRVDDRQERIRLLIDAIGYFDDLEDLGWLEGRLNDMRLTAARENTLKKMASLNGNAPETMAKLASLYERTERPALAEAIYSNRVEETRTDEPELLPDYVSALRTLGEFYWRHENIESAAATWKLLVGATEGYQQKQLILRFSSRLLAADSYEHAQWFAGKGLAINPVDQDFFKALASVHAEKEDYPALTALFKKTIDAIRDSDELSRDARKYRIESMRLGLIENLTKIGDHTAAVDQYIEIINAEPMQGYILEQAYRYARDHSLLERLTGFYKETAERSFKDYRWHWVLAQFARYGGDNAEVTQRLEQAVSLEPQRLDLRESLATAYIAQGEYQQAARQYEEIFRLDRKNLYWRQRGAETLRLAGKEDEAVEILRDIIEQSPGSMSRYFEFARLTLGWGRFEDALSFVDDGLAKVREDIYQYLLTDEDLATMVDCYVRSGDLMGAFDTLLGLNSLYATEANRKGNNRVWQARQGQTRTYNAFSGSFAETAREYADNSQLKAMDGKLRTYIQGASAPESTWQWVEQMAAALDFSELQRESLEKLLTFKSGDMNSSDYRNRLRDLGRFYSEHYHPAGFAGLLNTQLTDKEFKRFALTMLSMRIDALSFAGNEEALRLALAEYHRASLANTANLEAYSSEIEEYLELLHSAGGQTALAAIAASPGQYAGQIINFLGRNGYPDLALQAVDSLKKKYSQAWTDSKKMLLGMRSGLQPGNWRMDSAPVDLMRDFTIGNRVSYTPGADTFFSGSDWYEFSANYADFLFRFNEKETAFAIINGFAEASASNAANYRVMSQWYQEKELWPEAERHLATAFKLAPADAANFLAAGRLAHAKGETEEALEHWKALIDGNYGVDGYRLYFRTLREHDLYQQAKPAISTFTSIYFGNFENWQAQDIFYDIIPWISSNGDDSFMARELISAAKTNSNPLEILAAAFYNYSLATEAKVRLLKELISMARAESLATAGQEDYGTPPLKTWLEEAIVFAEEAGLWQQLHAWIGDYEEWGFDQNPTWRLGSEMQFTFIKAETLFAIGKKEEGTRLITDSIDAQSFSLEMLDKLRNSLKKLGLEPESLDLAIYFYSARLDKGFVSSSDQLKLADLLLERKTLKDVQRSARLISAALQSSLDDPGVLTRIAEVLEKHGQFEQAAVMRGRFVTRNPQDFKNRLALAENLRKAGKAREALEAYRELFASGTPASVQLSAINGYVEVASAGGAAEELQLYLPQALSAQRESISMLAHALATASGDSDTANQITAAARADLFEPATFLAWIGGEAPYAEADTALLARSLRMDAKKQTARALLEARLQAEEDVTGMLDDWQYTGVQNLERHGFEERFGLINRELMELLPGIVDEMIAAGRLDSAQYYESMRSDIAEELGLKIDSRSDQIQTMINEIEQTKSRFSIIESVSNK